MNESQILQNFLFIINIDRRISTTDYINIIVNGLISYTILYTIRIWQGQAGHTHN